MADNVREAFWKGCVKDRLARFFHWNDGKGLTQTMDVYLEKEVELSEMKKWGIRERHLEKFQEFLERLKRKKKIAKMRENKFRCFGSESGFYAEYHDYEWGIPAHDDRILFEMLSLEGAQAGLSWEIILKKREGYRELFHNFEPTLVDNMSDEELEKCLKSPKIIRNRRKIFSVRQNAHIFLQIQKEFGSFDRYLWRFVKGKPLKNHWKNRAEVPCETAESTALSKDLKKRGMTFVGPKIIYSFMQAVGMVNDHLVECWCYRSILTP